jgi:hypothetical protein
MCRSVQADTRFLRGSIVQVVVAKTKSAGDRFGGVRQSDWDPGGREQDRAHDLGPD